MGEGGNVPMLIFCLKNLCGWRDRFDAEAPTEEIAEDPKFPAMTSAQAKALLEQAKKKNVQQTTALPG